MLSRSISAEIERMELRGRHDVEIALAEGIPRHENMNAAEESSIPDITTDDLSEMLMHTQILPPDSHYTISIQGQEAVHTENVPLHAFQQGAFGSQYSHSVDVDPELEMTVSVPIWETLSNALNDELPCMSISHFTQLIKV